MVVNDYLETQFKPIMDYNFTASVEKEFDRIADGDITWVKMIHDFYGPFHQMVDTAIGTQTDKKSQARILGNDPKTGHIVKARIGRYGPMVEIEGEEGQKGRFASLKKGQLIESITLEEALALFALPRGDRPCPEGCGRRGQHSAAELPRRARHAGQERPLRGLHRLQGQELPPAQGQQTRRTHARRLPEDRRRLEEITEPITKL